MDHNACLAAGDKGDDYMTRLVASWCRWYDTHDPDDRWAEQDAISEFVGIGANMTIREAWSLVLMLLEAAPSDKVLGVIGASPIEDLLARDPVLVSAWIEDEARSNVRLRRALSHTWQMPSVVPDDVFIRVKQLAQDDLEI
jgi:uncharacterized protein DUF6869